MSTHPDATPLPQPDWMIQPPTPATEHPVRCPARLSFVFAVGDHTHECIHPAKRPADVVGVLEHKCHCGATWTEPTAAVEPTTGGDA